MFARLEWKVSPSIIGDKILLPPELLEAFIGNENRLFTTRVPTDKTPRVFTFALTSEKCTAYCGVREFSSEPGTITLSTALMDALALTRKKTTIVEDTTTVTTTNTTEMNSMLTDDTPSTQQETIENNSYISVRSVTLPRAKKVILQPVSSTFLDIHEPKFALEAGLRKNYTVLYPGQTLFIDCEGKIQEIIVVSLEPADAPACVIVDADVEVETLTPLNEHQEQKVHIIPLKPDEIIEGELNDPNKSLYFSFEVPSLSSDMSTYVPRITVSTLSGVPDRFIDTFISLFPHRKPSLAISRWSLLTMGHGSLLLIPETELHYPGERINSKWSHGKESIFYIGLSMSIVNTSSSSSSSITNDTCKFSLQIQMVDKSTVPLQEGQFIPREYDSVFDTSKILLDTKQNEKGKEEQIPGFYFCSNCHSSVPEINSTMHKATCARLNTRCTYNGCNAIIRRGPEGLKEHTHCIEPNCYAPVMTALMAKRHVDIVHTLRSCPLGCTKSTPMSLATLRKHVETQCEHRLSLCRYCKIVDVAGPPPEHIEDQAAGFTAHEIYCGSRSAPCSICRLILPMQAHAEHKLLTHHLSDEEIEKHGFFSFGTSDMPQSPLSKQSTDDYAFSQEARLSRNTLMQQQPQPQQQPFFDSIAEWQCTTCTYTNEGGSFTCSMCGNQRTTTLNDTSSNGSISNNSLSTSTISGSTSLCRNQVCARFSARDTTPAARLGLCHGCYSTIVASIEQPHFSTIDEDIAMQMHFMEALKHCIKKQLEDNGCNNKQCQNPCCIQGRKQKISLTKIPTIIEKLLESANATPSRYWICVNGRGQRLVIPTAPEGCLFDENENKNVNNTLSSGKTFGVSTVASNTTNANPLESVLSRRAASKKANARISSTFF